jgi:hypothetical protein
MSKLPPENNNPRDVIIKVGQSLVLHDGKRILINVKAAKDIRYFTAWKAIVGTEAEVAAKIAELKLS